MYVNSYAGKHTGKNTLALVADFTATVTTGCAPLSTKFTSTSTSDAGDPIVSYSWNFGDGSPVSTAVSPTHTYNTQNNFTVSLTVTTQSGATQSASKTNYISTYAKPVFNLGNDTIVCEGTELTFNTVSGYDTYTWSDPSKNTFPNAFFTPDPGVNIIWAEVGNGTCSVRDSIQVTVNSMLTSKWGYKVLSNCGDVQVQLLDSSSSCDPSNNILVAWIVDGTDLYIEPTPIHTFLTGGPHDVQHIAQDDNGNVFDTTITIMVPDPAAGPSSIVLRDTTICAGNSVQLDAGSDPGATYVWSPATGLSNTTIHNPVATPTSTQTYTVTATKCGIDSTANITVTVSPALTVNLGPDVDFCTGSFITLDAGNPGATYKWGSTYSPSYYGSRTTQTVSATGAGTYWVTVKKNGCTATDTIVLIPKKAIAAAFNYTPSGSGSCGPFTVQVAENAVLCAGSVASHDWNFGDGTIITGYNQTYNHTYSVPGTYTIRLIATSTGGVKDTVSHSVTYTGSALIVNLGNDTTICTGNSVTINAGNAGSTYLWSNGATTQSITVSPSSTTTYSVTVTGSGGCSGTDSKTVTVSGGLSVNLGNDTTICTGSSITINAGNAGSTYLWSNGATTQSISVSPSSTTTYSVTVTSGGGCTGTDSKTVTVSGLPIVNLGNDTTICVGSGLTLDAGNAGSTYLWSTGATTQSIIVGPMSATTYSVTVTNAGGCSASDSKTVNIGLAPSVNLGNDTTICAGNSVTINAGNAGSTYLWSNGATTQSITVSPSSTTTYSVTVTSSGGCTGTDSKTVTVAASLSVNLGNDTTICAGSSVTINAGNAGSTYLWSNGATTQSISVTPSSTTTYYVTVTSSGGCTGTDSKDVTVNPALVVNLGADQGLCPGAFMTLDAGNAGATYKWGSTYLPSYYASRTTQTINATGAGTYWVTVKKNGCTARDTIVLAPKTAITAEFTTTQSGSGSCGPYRVNVTENSEICTGSVADHVWDFGDGTVISGYNQTYSHDYTTAGVHTITLVVTTSGGIKDTIEHDVTFAGSSFAVNLGKDTTICSGSTLILDAGNVGSTYLWKDGQTSQTISVTTAGTYYVQVNNGICNAVDTINVAVSSQLNVNLGNDTTICGNNSVILDAGNAGATYLWSTNAGSATTQAVTVTPASGTNTYTVTVSNGACTGQGSINITVSTSLPVSLGADTAICAGSSITLDAGYPGAVYTWNDEVTTQTRNVTTAGTYNVSVNKNGCIGEDEINITLMNPPSPVNLGNDINVCFGNSIELDAADHAPSAYLWSTGATTQKINVTSSGTYHVSITGCGVTVRDTINVTMGNLPMPSITQSGLELISSDADGYQWYKDGNIIPGATGKKYKPRGYGNYSVEISNTAMGCSGKSADYWFVPSGQVYLGDVRVKVTPNPSNGFTKLVLSKVPAKPIIVTVYDAIGRRILSTTAINTVTDLNLMSFAKGIYFVECISGDQKVILPLITQ